MIIQDPLAMFLVLFLLPACGGLAFAYYIRRKKPEWREPFLWACLGFVTCMLFRYAAEFMFGS